MRTHVLIGAFFFVVGVASGQEKPEIKQNDPYSYVLIESEDFLLNIPGMIGQLMQEAGKQGIRPQGPIFCVISSAADANNFATLEGGIGFKVPKDAAVRPPLKKLEFAFQTVATAVSFGPYDNMNEAMIPVFSYIDENGYEQIGPVIVTWLDNPDQVPPEKCRTIVVVPVKKEGE